MALLGSHSVEIFADYHQFYLQDESVDLDWSVAWTEEAMSRMLATMPGFVAVGTAKDSKVSVVLEHYDQEPNADFEQWDHVAECSLRVDSDRIVVAGCTDYFPEAVRISLPPGEYCVRASYNLSENDSYRIQLWIGAPIKPRVLKYSK